MIVERPQCGKCWTRESRADVQGIGVVLLDTGVSEDMSIVHFRPPVHPAQSEYLIHFCGSGSAPVDPDIAAMSAPDRLNAILTTGQVRAFGTYGSEWPSVSLTESDAEAAASLILQCNFQPWGLVFRREWAWSRGGGPVWYVRSDQYHGAKSALGPFMTSFLVNTDPGRADWLHQREWRIPAPTESCSHIDFSESDLVAIVVGDPAWIPGPVCEMTLSAITGRPVVAELCPGTGEVERLCWNGAEFETLPPPCVSG